MSLITEILPTYAGISRDSRIDDIKSFLLNSFDFVQLVSDVGSGASRVVSFKIGDDEHILKLFATSIYSTRFDYMNFENTNVLREGDSLSISKDIVCNVVHYNSTRLLIMNNIIIFGVVKCGTRVLTVIGLKANLGFVRYAKTSDVELSFYASSVSQRVEGNKQILGRYFVSNELTTAIWEEPLDDIYYFANLDSIPVYSIVQAGNFKYIVIYSPDSGPVQIRTLFRYE